MFVCKDHNQQASLMIFAKQSPIGGLLQALWILAFVGSSSPSSWRWRPAASRPWTRSRSSERWEHRSPTASEWRSRILILAQWLFSFSHVQFLLSHLPWQISSNWMRPKWELGNIGKVSYCYNHFTLPLLLLFREQIFIQTLMEDKKYPDSLHASSSW